MGPLPGHRSFPSEAPAIRQLRDMIVRSQDIVSEALYWYNGALVDQYQGTSVRTRIPRASSRKSLPASAYKVNDIVFVRLGSNIAAAGLPFRFDMGRPFPHRSPGQRP